MGYELERLLLSGIDTNVTAVTLSPLIDLSAYTKFQLFVTVAGDDVGGDFNIRIVSQNDAGTVLRTTTCIQDITLGASATYQYIWGWGQTPTKNTPGANSGTFTDSSAGLITNSIIGKCQFGLNVTAGGTTGTIDMLLFARA